jgi:hypothetical protein
MATIILPVPPDFLLCAFAPAAPMALPSSRLLAGVLHEWGNGDPRQRPALASGRRDELRSIINDEIGRLQATQALRIARTGTRRAAH